ncbi:MAG TPA: DUF2461 domain-containing protein [Thermoflexales bacterium]|nr:DUF2461 domain-containing protein [Thermoflexales bacterium]
MTLQPALQFLAQLERNNNKAWFEENRPAYDAARAAVEDFLEAVIDALRNTDQLGDLTAKQCLMRIHRDIRFSRDKSPYNTAISASIAPGGRKSGKMGYYISVGPGNRTIVAGGLYSPTPEQLARFRKAIESDASRLRAIAKARPFVEHFGQIAGEKLKTAPKGYDRAHPDIDLLQLKQAIVIRHFTDAEILKPDFPEHVVAACKAMKPFVTWLDETTG